MSSALQDWTTKIPIMQQSVLLAIVRGPDNFPKYHPVKPILRWYRRCLLVSAIDGIVLIDPACSGGGSFTGPSCAYLPDLTWQQQMEPIVDDFFKTMDAMPIHFWLHMMHAVEIMGYKHSDNSIAKWWRDLYFRMVEAMHVWPELENQLDERLGDTLEGWKARSDKAITK